MRWRDLGLVVVAGVGFIVFFYSATALQEPQQNWGLTIGALLTFPPVLILNKGLRRGGPKPPPPEEVEAAERRRRILGGDR